MADVSTSGTNQTTEHVLDAPICGKRNYSLEIILIIQTNIRSDADSV